jgi:hypothetical protein
MPGALKLGFIAPVLVSILNPPFGFTEKLPPVVPVRVTF